MAFLQGLWRRYELDTVAIIAPISSSQIAKCCFIFSILVGGVFEVFFSSNALHCCVCLRFFEILLLGYFEPKSAQ
jgi:hypothetical protein